VTDVDPAGDWLGLVRSRRSIRRYKPDLLSTDVIDRLVAAATWAPSAHNRQPWRFVVITQPQTKERLAGQMGARLRSDRLADHDPAAAIEKDAARSYARITTAPVVIVACLTMAEMDRYADTRRKKAEYLMGTQSVAMAVQNLLLTAHAEGLGACWMCAPLFCGDAVRQALDLPADWEPQALITLGRPDDPGKLASRRSPSEVSVKR